eukprot:m.34393 g.34393  ORF g.34393 m.34393 type:complete len:351 (-) comp16968_c0_seq2:220-1272(-)
MAGAPIWIYLVAAIQWGILAPLNLVKVLLNVVSPTAHLWVPKTSETCQKNCGIARMWATLFWSGQIMFCIGYLYIYRTKHGKMPFALVGGLQKVVVGVLLIKAYFDNVVNLPIAMAGVFDLLIAPIMLLDAVAELLPTQSNESVRNGEVAEDSVTDAPGKENASVGVFETLRGFAARPWYPWVVGALSGINNFTVVLSGPLVVLYLSGVLANPKMRYLVAVANAVGTALGLAVLIYVMEQQGTDYVKDTFPTMFENAVWNRTATAVTDYGHGGAIFISAMPIILQPLVVLGLLAGMNAGALLACVFIGRVIKYCIMAELAVTAPRLLKFFGSAAVDASNKLNAEAEAKAK